MSNALALDASSPDSSKFESAVSLEQFCSHPLPIPLNQEPSDLDSVVDIAREKQKNEADLVQAKLAGFSMGAKQSNSSLNFLSTFKKVRSNASLIEAISPLRKNPSVEDAGSWYLHNQEPDSRAGSPMQGMLLKRKVSTGSMSSKRSGSTRMRLKQNQNSSMLLDRSDSLDFVLTSGDADSKGNLHGEKALGSTDLRSNAPSTKGSTEALVPVGAKHVAYLESPHIIHLEEQFLNLLKLSEMPKSVQNEIKRRQDLVHSESAQLQSGSNDFTKTRASHSNGTPTNATASSQGLVLSASVLGSGGSAPPGVPPLHSNPSFVGLGNAGLLGFPYTANLAHLQSLQPSSVSTMSGGSSGKANSRDKKLKGYEQMVARIKHPQMGFKIKDHKRGLQVYRRSFTGADLVSYLLKPPASAKLVAFMTKEEAMHYIKHLFTLGYFCSFGLYDKFLADSSYYVVQNSLLWVSHDWQPSELDYVCYLYRRQCKSSEKYHLEDYEEDILKTKRKALRRDNPEGWKIVEEKTKENLKFLKSFKDADRKLLQIWEAFFWRLHRPPPGIAPQSLAHKYSESQEPEESFYAPVIAAPGVVSISPSTIPSLSPLAQRFKNPLDLLEFYERQNESYRHQANLNLLKVSQSSKNLILRCEVLKFKDPLFNDDLYNRNPYIRNSPAFWEDERPHVNVEDLHLWSYTFNDLLNSSRGINIFRTFLQSELSHENLDFYLATRRLDQATSNYFEFRSKAQQVFDEFIQDDAERLININSSIRGPIIKAFEVYPLPTPEEVSSSKIITLRKRLPDNTFHAAQSHIFELMSKDSYQRFLLSDFWKEVYASVLHHTRAGSFLQNGVTEQLLAEPDEYQPQMLLGMEDTPPVAEPPAQPPKLKVPTLTSDGSGNFKRSISTAVRGRVKEENPPSQNPHNANSSFKV